MLINEIGTRGMRLGASVEEIIARSDIFSNVITAKKSGQRTKKRIKNQQMLCAMMLESDIGEEVLGMVWIANLL